MNTEELELKVSVPSSDISINDLSEVTYTNDGEQMSLGLAALGAMNKTTEIAPTVKSSMNNQSITSDEVTKEIGYIPIMHSGDRVSSLFGVEPSNKLTLHHSGYNIGVKYITPAIKMSLDVALIHAQSQIGLNTLGLAFGNDVAMSIKIVVDTLESMIEKSSFPSNNPLRDALITDLPHIMLLAMEDNIILNQICTSKLKETDKLCGALHSFTANWRDLIYTDLTDIDTSFLAKGKVTYKDKQEFYKYIKPAHTKLEIKGKQVTINYAIPTIGYYIDFGEAYLLKVEESVDAVLGSKSSTARKAMVASTFGMFPLKQYAHFIDNIVFEDGSVLKDIKDILNSIDYIDSKEQETIIADIKTFVKSNTFSIVGVPTYECKDCKQLTKSEDPDTNPFNDMVVPVNVPKLFLELTDFKVMKMVEE